MHEVLKNGLVPDAGGPKIFRKVGQDEPDKHWERPPGQTSDKNESPFPKGA